MKSFQNLSFPILASEKDCTGCFACINVCSTKAIDFYLGDDGHYKIKIDKEKCVGCLKCQKICLSSRNYFGNDNLNLSEIFAGWSNNYKDRKSATSGGVSSAFARYILKRNGCVVGASTDGKSCKHILVNKVDQIYRIQGSKYMYSSMEDVYKIIETELSEREVIFIGLGCQCAGVLAYFGNNNYANNLYTVDLVCGGVPSRILIDKFFNETSKIDQICSFRSKDKYELIVQSSGKKFVLKEKSLPLHGFNCGLTNRYCCYDCHFAKAHRKTDITIGDLWDYDIFPDEHKDGISMIIVHTSKGKKLLENSDIQKNEIPWNGALFKNKRIVYGKQKIFLPRKKLVFAEKNMSKEKFRKLYCIDMKTTDIFLFIFRVYRYLLKRKESFQAKKYIKSILKAHNSEK